MAKGTYTYEPGNITTAGLDLMRKRAKLMLLESICRRFAFEVDTKEGPLSFSLSDRAKVWKEDYLSLKKEVSLESMAVPSPPTGNSYKDPYFYTGMLRNPRTGRLDE